MEAGQRHLRHSADDPRQHLHHRRRCRYRRAHRPADRHFQWRSTARKSSTACSKPCTELLAGIPSIVYGFFGMVIIVPCIRTVAALFGADVSGSSILAASILLGIMILPTIIGVSEAALRAVPSAYYEGAVAMGARHERAIFTVMLPAAKSGVLAGIVLGIGRAIGETMAVIMVAGNQPRLTGNMLKGIRTMTANIVLEMGYATGLHREALIATGVVLFVFILIINLTFSVLERRKQA
ncbi:MAG: phosphate ABC transporter permease subunit PstC [Butyricicoccaceae bacterium]